MERPSQVRRLSPLRRGATRAISLLAVLPLTFGAGPLLLANVPPTVNMISPKNSTTSGTTALLSVTTNRTPILSATATDTDDQVASVQFQLASISSSSSCPAPTDGAWISVGTAVTTPDPGTTILGPPFSATYSLKATTSPAPLSPGTWCARAIATDNGPGTAQGTSSPVKFTVELDTDGDGLADRWEKNQIYVDTVSGLECVTPPTPPALASCVAVNLPRMGADPYRKDIFVVMDYFADATHTHALNAAALKKVVDAFDTAPVPAPPSSTPCPAAGDTSGATCKPGITLHVDHGPDSVKDFRCGTGITTCISISGVTIPKTSSSPISVTAATNHGLATGAKVALAGLDCTTAAGSTPLPVGNIGVNGIWTVTVTGATTFTLNNSAGTLSGSCPTGTGVVYTAAAMWGTSSNARNLSVGGVEVVQFGTMDALGNYVWTAFDARRDEPGGFTSKGLTPVAHYAQSVHQLANTTISGVARRADEITKTGKYFIVSLGTFSDVNTNINLSAGSFMHELGHNLGLGHGGPRLLAEPGVEINHKPNYLSVMNHSFQRYGLIIRASSSAPFTEGKIDYSRFSQSQLNTLNENSLSESTGLGSNASNYGTRRYCNLSDSWVAVTGSRGALVSASSNVDFNCNGSSGDSGVYDVTGSVSAPSPGETLTSFDDWANLQYAGGGVGATGVARDEGKTATSTLLTKTEADKVAKLVTIDVRPNDTANIVNLGPNSNVAVAILTRKDFDANTVDGKTVRFGKVDNPNDIPPDQLASDPVGGKIEDADKDGLLDLVLHFDTGNNETKLTTADTRACLTGKTLGGQKIFGCDDVTVVNPAKK